MKNYITIAALLAAGTAFANADQVVEKTEAFTFTNDSSLIQLENEFLLTKDWTLTFSAVVTPAIATNEYGTAIISSETDPIAEGHNIQVYAGVSGENIVVKANGWTDNHKAPVGEGSAWNAEAGSLVGPSTFSLVYTAESGTLKFTCVDGYENTVADVVWTGITYDANDVLTKLSTSITSDQLDAKCYDVYDAWTLPAGSFTGYVVSQVPEPSAFGLLAGIGALALVASRRRRK